MTLNLWLIPLLPLVGAAINGLLGKNFSRKLVATIALAFTAASFAWAALTALRFIGLPTSQVPVVEHYAPWLRAGSFVVEWGFQLDQLSMVMMLVVTGVGFLIHIYSVAYMEHEGGYYRFFAYLNLFMFFMLTLVLGSNYLVMFVGWEGVGLASYLLIGFFFLRDSAANAGKKAFITNRVGDFGFLIALFLLIKHFGSLQYSEIFKAVSTMPVEAHAGVLTAIALLMMLGAAGKSAQIPLYVWLPDAMEGPTPVSALIHAATMVTAGVYMVARSNAIFNRAPDALAVVAVIGALTAIFAATIGMAQTDIKRVLAYSTVSQLGYMFLACGVAAYTAGIFHLMTHAFFKALLFLGAGSVIHGVGGEQDMRKMGGLKKYMPVTFWVMLIATMAIAGIPGFAGFFSKDEILWQAYSSPHGHWVLWTVGVITALMTSFYMFRLIFMTFFGEYRGPLAEAHVGHEKQPHGTPGSTEHAGHGHAVPMGGAKTVANAPHVADDHGHHGAPHESPWMMLAPLVILAVLSIIGGYVGIGNRFGHFLSPVISKAPAAQSEAAGVRNESETATAGEHATTPLATGEPHTTPVSEGEESAHEKQLEYTLMGVSILAAFGGLFFAWVLYYKRRDLPERITATLGGVYETVLNKYYVDEIYQAVVITPINVFSTKVLWKGIDANIIDGTVNESARGAMGVSDGVRQQQSGNIRSYAGWVAAGAAAVIAYMVWMGVAR
jgi:NADH-quinone oxidoreductase subunit L